MTHKVYLWNGGTDAGRKSNKGISKVGKVGKRRENNDEWILSLL